MAYTPDTIITIQLGFMLTMFGSFGLVIYKYAELKFTLEHLKEYTAKTEKDLKAAHNKIRALEVNGKN